jgi:hypothetical protein
MSKYKGDIENFPEEVVEWMCDQQVKQGNPRDVRVFEKYKLADHRSGGFTWVKVDIPIECRYGSVDFCEKVIEDKEFELIAQYFPKKSQSAPEIDIDAILQIKPTEKPKLAFDENRLKAACAAMRGILSNPHCPPNINENKVAAASVAYGDALIEALKKGKQDDTTTTP